MERRVGQLEVDMGTLSQRMLQVENWVPESRTFHNDMQNFKTALLAQQAAVREEQNRKHRQNSWKLSVIMACIAFGTLLIAIASFVTINWFSKHAQLDPVKIMKSQDSEPVEARMQKYIATQ